MASASHSPSARNVQDGEDDLRWGGWGEKMEVVDEKPICLCAFALLDLPLSYQRAHTYLVRDGQAGWGVQGGWGRHRTFRALLKRLY